MNRADRMLEVLADGRKRTRHQIFAEAGMFFMTNNAAAELRARGVDVLHTREGRVDCYQLREPGGSVGADGSGSRSGSPSLSRAADSPLPTTQAGPRDSRPEGTAPPSLSETEVA